MFWGERPDKRADNLPDVKRSSTRSIFSDALASRRRFRRATASYYYDYQFYHYDIITLYV